MVATFCQEDKFRAWLRTTRSWQLLQKVLTELEQCVFDGYPVPFAPGTTCYL